MTVKNTQKFPYKKILIIGCGGAGKSTLACELGKRFSLPVVHLDKIWWLPEWQNRSEQEFDKLIDIELKKDKWIIDGNYERTLEKRLQFADFCIYLDYPVELCIESVFKRLEKFKGTTRPDMTKGCIEQVDDEFEQWIYSFNENIRPKMLSILNDSKVPFIIFTSRKQAEEWLYTIN